MNDKEIIQQEVELNKRKVLQREDSIQENNLRLKELRDELKKKDTYVSDMKYDLYFLS